MQDAVFEWDDEKAALNWRRHGVAFSLAVLAFRDPFALEWIDAVSYTHLTLPTSDLV